MKSLLVIVLLAGLAFWAEAGMVIVVHPGNSTSYLRKESLEAMYKGRIKNWADGKRVRLAFYRDSYLQKEVLEKYISMSQSQFDNHWSSLIYTGKADQPAYFYTQSEVVDFVANNVGALGFVEAEKVTAEVRVLRVVDAEEARALEEKSDIKKEHPMPKAVR